MGESLGKKLRDFCDFGNEEKCDFLRKKFSDLVIHTPVLFKCFQIMSRRLRYMEISLNSSAEIEKNN